MQDGKWKVGEGCWEVAVVLTGPVALHEKSSPSAGAANSVAKVLHWKPPSHSAPLKVGTSTYQV